ncbi:MAG: tRNA pseudouridine(55) synthase TruB [Candidatus Puniceispirillaceae bacterium]
MTQNHDKSLHGWLVLDKPVGISSAAAVGIIKRAFGGIKAGHGGTLDPLASGILPIALGEATKTTSYAMGAEKSYEFEVLWGQQTATDDSEGAVIATSDKRPTAAQIDAILPNFTGLIEQIPPAYSAVKVKGRRAYAIARHSDETPELAPRQIQIDELRLLDITSDSARFATTCGKGTYIRSLARDMALSLGTVGHVSALRRTKVGQFSLKNAISLDFFENLRDSAAASPYVMPVLAALDDIPALSITPEEAQKLRFGQLLSVRPDMTDSIYKAVCDGALIALIKAHDTGIKPVRVFHI